MFIKNIIINYYTLYAYSYDYIIRKEFIDYKKYSKD